MYLYLIGGTLSSKPLDSSTTEMFTPPHNRCHVCAPASFPVKHAHDDIFKAIPLGTRMTWEPCIEVLFLTSEKTYGIFDLERSSDCAVMEIL
jgi:hypothetical protein